MLNTITTIVEYVVTSGPDHHVSVVHDQVDGFTVATVALNDIPDNAQDFTLPELRELIATLSDAAALLEELAPVPYTVVM